MNEVLNWEYMPLVPPLLTLILVLATRKVLLSLGLGIITSAIVLADGNIMGTLNLIWEHFIGIFIDDGGINTWNAYILIFLVLLGIMISFINMSGGVKRFTDWAIKRVRSRKQANFMTALLGIIIFIDDYFSALIVGQVARPLTDKYQVSRAKLSYFIDTTASPVSVVSPISSWGAGIMGLVAPLLVAAELNNTSSFQAFIQMIPMNFYVIAALLMMFIVIFMRFDIGAMRTHEERALLENTLYDHSKETHGEAADDLPVEHNSSAQALIVPLLSLIVTVMLAMYITGGLEAGAWDAISVFENTLVTDSLVIGGIVGLICSVIYYFIYTKNNAKFGGKETWLGIKTGFLAMFPAMLVLTLAWIIGGLIAELGTGDILANWVESSYLPAAALPAVVFAVSCVMALATGTSWGSFGILIPISGQIIISLNHTELLLPTIAAVLAGSVFGDHCSPISDSTILAATGAGSNHIDHVVTQIPYAVISAIIACIGYLVVGFTSSIILSIVTVVGLLALMVVLQKLFFKPLPRHKEE